MPENKHQELDQLIARYYVKDPEASQKTIADTIEEHHPGPGRSSSNALKRIEELVKQEVLIQRTDIIDWKAVGYPSRYRIDVHVDQEALREPGLRNSYGAPEGQTPDPPVDNWRRLARYIMEDLVPFLESIPKDKTVLKNRFSKDDVIVQNVMILLGEQADLTVILRARNQEAVLSFVVDGLRAMRGVRMTKTAHEAWSVNEGEL